MYSKITVLGSGNVGYHLAKRLYNCGHTICQVYSRTQNKAEKLAKITNSEAISNLEHLSSNAELYILAIKDHGVEKVAEKLFFLNKFNKTIAHTSGTLSSSIFKPFFDNYGVFYPLQTFSTNKTANFERLPFCIYGNNPKTEKELMQLAETICPNVHLINDKQRAILHVSAVIVNNFSNYLYGIAHDICKDHDVSFDILKPLIEETAQKIKFQNPQEIQTGPAARGDSNIIAKHIEFLSQYPDHQLIYKLITKGIENW